MNLELITFTLATYLAEVFVVVSIRCSKTGISLPSRNLA